MGSKGSATQTTQNVNQTYSADPRTQQAAGQALQGAEAAAAQPFQMPVAPVAGFSQDQLSAFGNYQNLAGPNSYLNTAAGYAGQAAAPITANDVNQYYNPMADNVTKQLQNIYGQQNSQNQGMLTAQAGGVGADRIAVGMGNLANQQGLASGQIYSQLYQQALQAAQQQKQMAAGAAGQFGQIEQGALGATGALNAAGTQQQQQTQQQLNAPYQNTLARIAYQFQTPQYLAGIAGGLAPALGGTTNGLQVTNPPQPSTLSQVLGIGTAGAGLYGAFGGFGGSGSNPAYGADGIYGGSGSNPLPGLSPGDYGQGYAKGGEVEGFDDGGTPDPMLQFPGTSVPKIGNPEAIPTSALPMGGGHSGMLGGQGIQFAQPQQQSNNSNNIGNDIASALKIATLFAKRGGGIPHYDGGGDVNDPSSPNYQPYTWGRLAHDVGGLFSSPAPAAPAASPPSFNERFDAASPPATFNDRFPQANTPLPIPRPPQANHPQTLERMERPSKGGGSGGGGGASTAGIPTAQDSGFTPPYPDALSRDPGQVATRSPWMALVNAGATMAATPGPLGVSLGKGMLAGTASLDKQRGELRSEQELNDKAQQLYDTAQQHLMKYNKMTAYERAEVGLKNRELDQAENGVAEAKPISEMDIKRVVSDMRGQLGYVNPGYEKEREAAYNYIKTLRSRGAGAGAPAAPAMGTPKEFDDGKGGKVTGYWNGTTYAPKAP